jgi:PAS domain S-box-containing protein
MVIDKDGRVIAWNKAIEDMTGVKAEDLLGKGDYEYAIPFYGQRRPILIDLVQKPQKELEIIYSNIKRQAGILVGEAYISNLKGRMANLHGTAAILYNSSGIVVGAIESIGDITERKRIESALLESEERYRAFFSTSRDCVFITSVDGRWVDLNDAAVQFFGYESKEDLLNVEIKDLYTNSDERVRHLQTINENGYTQEYQVALRKKDGTIIDTLITSVTRKDSTGRIIGYQGTIRDITECKRAQEALRESEQRMANIIDFLPDATFAVDREG